MDSQIRFRRPVNGNYLFYLEPTWDWTKRSWNYTPDSPWVRVAQIIAKMMLVPFFMIAAFELAFKHIPCLAINAAIALINGVHGLLNPQQESTQ